MRLTPGASDFHRMPLKTEGIASEAAASLRSFSSITSFYG